MRFVNTVAAAAALCFIFGSTASAQVPERPFIIEARGGIYVPTFDIADLADPGFGAGATFGYMVTPKIMLFGEADFGFHSASEDIDPDDQLDVNVYHYMAKAGYVVYQSRDEKLKLLVNGGVGAMTIEFDTNAASESNTYLAINAGAKLYYMFSRTAGFVLSPQGDIAFTDDQEIPDTSSGWVWPVTAGFFVNF